MDLDQAIAALLVRRRRRVTPAVGAALAEFVAVVEDEAAKSTQRDEDEPEDGDGVRTITCPHCGERIAMAIDLSGGDQDDIQDCEVCCRPIRITYTVERGQLRDFAAEPA